MHLEIKKKSESMSEKYLTENEVYHILNAFFIKVSDFFILKIVASFDQHKEEHFLQHNH